MPLDVLAASAARDATLAAPPRRVVFQPPRYVIASVDTMATDSTLTPAGGFSSRAAAAQALRDHAGAETAAWQVVEDAA